MKDKNSIFTARGEDMIFYQYNTSTFKDSYYIDTDEIPGFFHLLKYDIFTAHSEDTIFIFHVCGYCDK